MIKPRITKVSQDEWECACDLVSQRGATAGHAYDLWLHISLCSVISGHMSKTTKRPAAKPRHVGRPITIKPVHKVVPVVESQPEYHPSVVNVIAGTYITREYRTPASMHDNLNRAAQSEPKLSPLVSKNLREGRRFGL